MLVFNRDAIPSRTTKPNLIKLVMFETRVQLVTATSQETHHSEKQKEGVK